MFLTIWQYFLTTIHKKFFGTTFVFNRVSCDKAQAEWHGTINLIINIKNILDYV